MSTSRVLFKLDHAREAERTEIDIPADDLAIPIEGELANGPALAAFDLGVRIGDTLTGIPAPLHLPAEIDDDTRVIDDPDAEVR